MLQMPHLQAGTTRCSAALPSLNCDLAGQLTARDPNSACEPKLDAPVQLADWRAAGGAQMAAGLCQAFSRNTRGLVSAQASDLTPCDWVQLQILSFRCCLLYILRTSAPSVASLAELGRWSVKFEPIFHAHVGAFDSLGDTCNLTRHVE